MVEEYKKEVERLKELGREWNLSQREIDKIFEDSVRFLESKKPIVKNTSFKLNFSMSLLRLLVIISLVIFLIPSLVVYRKSVQNIVERNVQEIIYPGMKLFRKLMLPVIKTFPSLTEWYDENCLVRNPYFQVSDIDCWPCSTTRSILNLTGSDLSSDEYHSGIPFIYKEEQMKHVSIYALREMYRSNKDMFDQHAPHIEDSSSGTSKSVEEFFLGNDIDFYPSKEKDVHTVWKLIRLEPARAARRLFGFPQKSPGYTSGTAPEKFIIIDEASAPPYSLPATEGSTVFVVQGSGSRLLVLDPAPECATECHRVSLLLQPGHILWYNWWYWRASSFPIVSSEETSVTYIGSYF